MLGIILVNYKSHDETVHYITHELSKIEVPNVVVVVNVGDDGESGSRLAQAMDAQHYLSSNLQNAPRNKRVVISESENLGFARGNNLGFRFFDLHFDVPWLLITNNDLVLVDEDIVQAMIHCADSNPNIGIVGPKIRNTEGRDQSPHRYRSIWAMLIIPKVFSPVWAIWRRIGMGREVIANAESGIYHRVVGCFFLVRTNAFRQAEGFDERTFLYGEERILSSRLRKLGFETFFLCEKNLIHKHRQTTSNYLSQRKTKQLVLSSLLIYFRNYDNQPRWVCNLARFADWLEATVYEPIINRWRQLTRTSRHVD